MDQAAQLRNWTPTALIRRAAVERAAQIVNAESHTALGLQAFAEQLAELLTGDRQYFSQSPGEPPVPTEDTDDVWTISTPSRLSDPEVEKLDEALVPGGMEFLRLIVERCKFLRTARRTSNAPAPIDPSKILQEGRK